MDGNSKEKALHAFIKTVDRSAPKPKNVPKIWYFKELMFGPVFGTNAFAFDTHFLSTKLA